MSNYLKILYMHIGLPKTGTSFLQSFLCHNSKMLIEKGVYYPDLSTSSIYNCLSVGGHRNGNAFPLAYTYLDDQSITNCPLKGIVLGNLAKILSDEDNNVLLSSEWLSLLRPYIIRAIYNLALSYGFSLKIICYIRRQDLFIESEYNQRIKMKRSYISFEDFMYVTNFFNSLKSFIGVLPDELILIKCMEKRQFYLGNLIDDFLGCIGIKNSLDFIVSDKPINKSLSYGALNLLNAMNQNGFDYSPAMNILIDTLESMPSEKYYDISPSWLSPSQRHNIMAQCEASNSDLAKRFFGSDRKDLFIESIPSINSDWLDARRQIFNSNEIDYVINKLKNRQNISNMKEIIAFIHSYNKQCL